MAEALNKQREVTDRYADALFDLAREQSLIEAVRDELTELVHLERTEQAFADFLHSRALDDDYRAASLEKMLRGRISDLVLNTLQIMNRHGRSGYLTGLLESYIDRQNAAANQVVAHAVTAVALSAEEQESVRAITAEVSGKQPLMTFHVDPGVLGGLLLRVGDMRFDATVQWHLRETRRRLAEHGERGIEVRQLNNDR